MTTRGSAKPNEQQLKALAGRLKSLSGLVAAYLHGSGARGRLRPESDLDIALLFEAERPSASILLDLAVDLEPVIGRTLHLGVLSCENLIYATEVYQHGRELLCLDEALKDRFFMQLLSSYADFNHARREVLDAYLVREGDSDGYSAE